MESRKALSQLTYQLIYPAILGSILFDLFDPFRSFSEIRFVGLLIGLCFVIDYLHMTLNLCKDGSSEVKYGALFDMLIAFLFCWSYFALAQTTGDKFSGNPIYYYKLSFSLFFISHFLIVIYEIFLNKRTNILSVSPLFLIGLGYYFLYVFKNHAITILIIVMLLVLTIYTFRVIKVYPKEQTG